MSIEVAVAQEIARSEDVLFALLFGSRAGGRPRADSDWDVGIYFRDSITPDERFRLRLALEAKLAKIAAVQVVVLNEAPPLLAQRALQGRRLSIQDPSAYVRFYVRTQAEAGDELFWREVHRNARTRRLTEGRFGRP